MDFHSLSPIFILLFAFGTRLASYALGKSAFCGRITTKRIAGPTRNGSAHLYLMQGNRDLDGCHKEG